MENIKQVLESIKGKKNYEQENELRRLLQRAKNRFGRLEADTVNLIIRAKKIQQDADRRVSDIAHTLEMREVAKARHLEEVNFIIGEIEKIGAPSTPKKKAPPKPKEPPKKEDNGKIRCAICGNEYTPQNIQRHMEACKRKKEAEMDLKRINGGVPTEEKLQVVKEVKEIVNNKVQELQKKLKAEEQTKEGE